MQTHGTKRSFTKISNARHFVGRVCIFACVLLFITSVMMWITAKYFPFRGSVRSANSALVWQADFSQMQIVWVNLPNGEFRSQPAGNSIPQSAVEFHPNLANHIRFTWYDRISDQHTQHMIVGITNSGNYITKTLRATHTDFSQPWPYGMFSYKSGHTAFPSKHPFTAIRIAELIFYPLHVSAFALILFMYGFACRYTRSKQARGGLCPGCHYDLRGSVESGRCPECGRSIDEAQMEKLRGMVGVPASFDQK